MSIRRLAWYRGPSFATPTPGEVRPVLGLSPGAQNSEKRGCGYPEEFKKSRLGTKAPGPNSKNGKKILSTAQCFAPRDVECKKDVRSAQDFRLGVGVAKEGPRY